MTTQEVANRLYELCQKGQFETAQNELYHPEATSTESDRQGERQTVKGIEAIKAKGKAFMDSVEEMHGGYTNEPKVFGNYIFMELGMDATFRGVGQMAINEMCHYEVKDGKIVSEAFYY
ncbi:MAG: nuclear transport factor 2 family protein [Taibaiella sp.]|nr:nuclear transport factor 2 family protein [Taibaiella sp.]